QVLAAHRLPGFVCQKVGLTVVDAVTIDSDGVKLAPDKPAKADIAPGRQRAGVMPKLDERSGHVGVDPHYAVAALHLIASGQRRTDDGAENLRPITYSINLP